MSREKKVLKLFNFIMDLLDEGETETVKKIENPKIDNVFNRVFNRVGNNDGDVELTDKKSRALDLMKKVDEITHKKAEELGRIREVNKMVKPHIQELEALKSQIENMMRDDRISETLEDYGFTDESKVNSPVDEIKDNNRTGVTIDELGEIKIVNLEELSQLPKSMKRYDENSITSLPSEKNINKTNNKKRKRNDGRKDIKK